MQVKTLLFSLVICLSIQSASTHPPLCSSDLTYTLLGSGLGAMVIGVVTAVVFQCKKNNEKALWFTHTTDPALSEYYTFDNVDKRFANKIQLPVIIGLISGGLGLFSWFLCTNYGTSA